jgi:hypothetical protein
MNDSPYNHFDCGGGCSSALPLTIADKELITGRTVRSQDDDGIWFCGDCGEDLPADRYLASFHVCGDNAPQKEVAPVVEHKTRTTPPTGYVQDEDGVRRFHQRGRVMFDKSSFAICTCGWMAAGATREEARWRARAHREEQAAKSGGGSR